MSTNSQQFLQAFNAIEQFLRDLTQSDRYATFYSMVDNARASDASVRRFVTDLKEFADLRNAIVHERGDGRVLAEPNERAVRQIVHLEQLLLKPPRVLPDFATDVYTMTVDDPVLIAAFAMRERDFSQVPVYDGKAFAGLLTGDDVARWLGACVNDGQLELQETTLGSALASTASHENVQFVHREATLFEVLEAFRESNRRGKRLEAILITHSGKTTEKLLGIITVWDLPRIYEKL